jgi:hypothetical protein
MTLTDPFDNAINQAHYYRAICLEAARSPSTVSWHKNCSASPRCGKASPRRSSVTPSALPRAFAYRRTLQTSEKAVVRLLTSDICARRSGGRTRRAHVQVTGLSKPSDHAAAWLTTEALRTRTGVVQGRATTELIKCRHLWLGHHALLRPAIPSALGPRTRLRVLRVCPPAPTARTRVSVSALRWAGP